MGRTVATHPLDSGSLKSELEVPEGLGPCGSSDRDTVPALAQMLVAATVCAVSGPAAALRHSPLSLCGLNNVFL